jgi:hypothetical protein
LSLFPIIGRFENFLIGRGSGTVGREAGAEGEVLMEIGFAFSSLNSKQDFWTFFLSPTVSLNSQGNDTSSIVVSSSLITELIWITKKILRAKKSFLKNQQIQFFVAFFDDQKFRERLEKEKKTFERELIEN